MSSMEKDGGLSSRAPQILRDPHSGTTEDGV